jgi:trehalose 6-phosphate synthase
MQTDRDRRNFLDCTDRFHGTWSDRPSGEVATQVRHVPIGIDVDHYEKLGNRTDVAGRAQQIRHDVQGKRLILGVDRLDYTKGLLVRLEAFQRALELYPELIEQATLVQHVVPSREQVPTYRELREALERLVGEINGRYGTASWVPVRYHFDHLAPEELAAYYRAADAVLITPLKDGMNLIAKEFCACRVDEGGALILSEFAGAAEQLADGAFLVNPYDRDGMAETIRDALRMAAPERRDRMKRLRTRVREFDVHRWARTFLAPLTEAKGAAHDTASASP